MDVVVRTVTFVLMIRMDICHHHHSHQSLDHSRTVAIYSVIEMKYVSEPNSLIETNSDTDSIQTVIKL
jgi:uncharacterized protein YrrD